LISLIVTAVMELVAYIFIFRAREEAKSGVEPLCTIAILPITNYQLPIAIL
jgi:hypothetical protein